MPVAMNPSVSWTNDPLTLTAKVNAVVAPEQVMLWECGFIPSLESDGLSDSITFDGIEGVNANSDRPFEGHWSLYAESGAFDATHTVEVVLLDADNNPTGAPLATLDALGGIVDIIMPYKVHQDRVRIWQPLMPFAATVTMTRVENYVTMGDVPLVTAVADQLTVTYHATPMKGVLTAQAIVYDDTIALLVASDATTLNIRE